MTWLRPAFYPTEAVELEQSMLLAIKMIIGVLISSMETAYRLESMLLGVPVLAMIAVFGYLVKPTTGKARSNSAILPEMSCLSAPSRAMVAPPPSR